jgi:SAM-dependent methyltransferase
VTGYEQDTRAAYLSPTRAAEYSARQTRSWTWSRISTRLELRAVERLLAHVKGDGAVTMLDAPCGTGIAAPLLRAGGFAVLGSDISRAMMDHARAAYRGTATRFVCGDLTQIPLAAASFDCVLALGFLHRLPPEIRRAVLIEFGRVSRRFVIVSCSLDSSAQRVKQQLLRYMSPGHVPAPSPASLDDLRDDFRAAGLVERRRMAIAPLLSAESVFLLGRR